MTTDSHATAADELRILGRRLGTILIISNGAVLLQHKPGAGDGFSAVAADALDT